ncbi:MAG: CbiX/SirB N-terminal domain-containing protein [Archaeoglobaceae archaeon]
MKALILLGHGSKVPGFDEVMEYHKNRIEAMGIFDQIEIAYASAEPGIQEVVDKVTCEEVYIVPLFMAHGAHLEELPSLLGLEGRRGKYKDKDILICDHIGKSELITHSIINSAIMGMGQK